MIRYTLRDGKVQIDPETLTVKAFHDIWDYDKSQKKGLASNILTYVFTMYDEREINPFRDVSFDKKDAACKKNAFGDQDHKFSAEELQLIGEASDWFDFLNANPITRLARAADKAIDRCATFLDTADIQTIQDMKAVSAEIKNISGIIKSRKDVDKEMKEEMDKSKLKGGGKQSLNSRKILR